MSVYEYIQKYQNFYNIFTVKKPQYNIIKMEAMINIIYCTNQSTNQSMVFKLQVLPSSVEQHTLFRFKKIKTIITCRQAGIMSHTIHNMSYIVITTFKLNIEAKPNNT